MQQLYPYSMGRNIDLELADEPPPLGSLPDQVAAAQWCQDVSKRSRAESSGPCSPEADRQRHGNDTERKYTESRDQSHQNAATMRATGNDTSLLSWETRQHPEMLYLTGHSAQQSAAQKCQDRVPTTSGKSGSQELQVATVTVPSKPSKLRRGFFDSRPKTHQGEKLKQVTFFAPLVLPLDLYSTI